MASARSLAWQFLASWLGEGLPPRVDPPFALIAEMAYRHRLEPLLGTVALPPSLPTALTERFCQATEAARAAQIERFPAVQEVLALLGNWPVVVFKGFAAAELLYADVGARSMGDVDLLVRPEDFAGAQQALKKGGFLRSHVGHPVLDHPSHHERELSNGKLVIDLHQGFTQSYRVPLDYSAVHARSLPWTALAPNARLTSPEDAVLAQAIHLAIGELTPQAAPIIGVVDLRLMLARQAPFWGPIPDAVLDLDRLNALSKACGASRILYAVLAFAAGLFPSLAPALDSQPGQLPRGTRAILDRIVRRATPPALQNPLRIEVLWRKAMLLPPRGRRALFLRQLPLQLRYHVGRFLGRYE